MSPDNFWLLWIPVAVIAVGGEVAVAIIASEFFKILENRE
jgi:hypothetical protein